MSASAIVLCGGRSSRMGRAKAWLPWRGRPMLAHVVGVLREVVDDVVVVASPDQEVPKVDAHIVRDREAGLGPLAGISSGLCAAKGELAFVTATDAPYLSADFVRALLAFGTTSAPLIDGFVQTLSCVYDTRTAATAQTLLAEGRRRPLDLLQASGYREVLASELPDARSVEGFNTPDAYLDAVRVAEPGAEATVELTGRAGAEASPGKRAVPVDSLGTILSSLAETAELVRADRIAQGFAVCLDARFRLHDARAPIGPGEHVVVRDDLGESPAWRAPKA